MYTAEIHGSKNRKSKQEGKGALPCRSQKKKKYSFLVCSNTTP